MNYYTQTEMLIIFYYKLCWNFDWRQNIATEMILWSSEEVLIQSKIFKVKKKKNEIIFIFGTVVFSYAIHSGNYRIIEKKKPQIYCQSYFLKPFNVAFSTIVKIFYEKASKTKTPMTSKLDFMLQITENITNIAIKLKVPMIDLKTIDEIDKLLAKKVPQEMRIKDLSARAIIHQQYKIISEIKQNIEKINAEICKYIEYKSISNESNQLFAQSFDEWKKKMLPMKQKWNVSMMLWLSWNRCILNCTINSIIASKSQKNLELILIKISLQSNQCTKHFRKTNDSEKANVLIEKAVVLATNLLEKMNTFLPILDDVKLTLYSYNNQPIIWTEMVIGLKK